MLFFPADSCARVPTANEGRTLGDGSLVDVVKVFCTKAEADAAAAARIAPNYTGSGSFPYDCWGYVRYKSGSTLVYTYWYPLYTSDISQFCCDDYASASCGALCDTVCSSATFSVSVSGPGYVDGDACGTEIKCPGGSCSGQSEGGGICFCGASITAHPNIDTGSVNIDCDSECSVSGKSASCVIDQGKSASCTVTFGDLCTDDTDGDGVKDYVDPHPLEADDPGLPFYLKELEIPVGLGTVVVDPKALWEYLNSDRVIFVLCRVQNTYYDVPMEECLRGSSASAGGASASWDEPVQKIACDPRYEYCPSVPLSELDQYVPCVETDYGPEIKPPSDTPILDPTIPDGVYTPEEGLNPDCQCFDTVNENTAATVDMLKELHKVESVISENVETLVENSNDIKSDLNDMKSDLSDIAENSSDIAEDISDVKDYAADIADNTDDILDALDTLPEDIIDELNTDSAKLSVSDGLDLTAEDLGGFTAEDQAEIQALAETEKDSFKQQLTAFNTKLMNDFKGRFQITSASEQCSFSVPIFDGRNVDFDACSYSGYLDMMGSFVLFLAYSSGVFIILKA